MASTLGVRARPSARRTDPILSETGVAQATDNVHDAGPGRATIIGGDPLGRPNPRLTVAVARAGGLGVLTLDRDPDRARRDIATVVERTDRSFAIAIPAGQGTLAAPTHRLFDRLSATLPATVAAIVVDGDDLAGPDGLETPWVRLHCDRELFVIVRDRATAAQAIAAGATALIASGRESGGRVGDTEAFILLQQVVDLGVPIWVRGGIGEHSAAGVVAAGATGVVLDAQLGLVREAGLPDAVRHAIGAMDGSETRVLAAHRVFTRPDLAVARLVDGEQTGPEVSQALGDDLERDLVPLGQDAALARGLAERYRTAGGVVQAVRAAIDTHLDAARRLAPLAPGAGVAASHQLRYPIAQGPMTRVSDRAAFAEAVAAGGGLPFLALALMPGHEVRALLEETATRLGDRPWGVGILGFVPPELREEQLAAVTDAAPPVALIAGGRPSQAAPLEARGIETYLHVPSPGLLDRFVKDGARRFVFEGRECGGHVGPRASLGLWDAQIERLLAVPDPENLHVLFAGGIHDARSAAAAAAIGAPLAERGAHLGVLMGTAYLFTEEAVRDGAIQPGFQDTAVACSTTVLLETSPGHATRCVETDYVQAFTARKADLVAAGTDPKAMWAELEELNLGRLRMASKGVARRAGDGDLIRIDPAEQQAEGMYMIGQVATLRSSVTTIAALHDEVTRGATEQVAHVVGGTITEGRLAEQEAEPTPARLDIAIVGMAAMFPGAVDVEEFWANIVRGANAITEVSPERWDPDRYYDPDPTRPGGRTTPSKWGGFLPAIDFDPLAYGIPPASLGSIEPVQLLSLEVAAQALADAGYADRPFDRSRASVVFGAENGNDLSGAYGFRSLFPQLLGELPPELDEHLPVYDEDSFPGVLTNVIAGRIANRLDLGGVNYTVDAACAASLAALDAACKELVTGHSDLVLCGGADLHNGINDYLLFASVHALSPTGQCRTFDADADGIALGEGIACVVLKRLADAERDGDRIYAVIEAVAGSSDGRHLGLTAPRKEGQQRALHRAYAQAGHSPASVGLVEAHGTGTVVGDRTELATLTEVFADQGVGAGTVVLGSVKSQIGHTKCAAGLAGLIKAARAIHHGVLPPTLNVDHPNPYHEPLTNPFRFNEAARPWTAKTRRAGVSAFGFGGANFHAVLSSYAGDEAAAHGVEGWPAEIFTFRAGDHDAAMALLDAVQVATDAVIAADPAGARHRLRDLAATVSATGSGPVQIAIVATDWSDLAAKLALARAGIARPDGVFLVATTAAALGDLDDLDDLDERGDPEAGGTVTRGAVAFLYPGQGSQRPNMLADLFVTFPALRRELERGERWLDALFPPTAYTAAERAAQRSAITDTRVAQPTLGIAGLALTELWRSVGVTPDTAAGHSYGELLALAAAGSIHPQDLLDLSAARGEAIVAATSGDPGTMAAVRGSAADAERVLQGHDRVVVANHNSPRQVVISGPTDAIQAAEDALGAAGVATTRLGVACAFHSPVVARASSSLARFLTGIDLQPPAFPVWANASASVYPTTPDAIRMTLAAQVASPVRFAEQIEAMYAAGARIFVEAGPGRVLTGFVDAILGDLPHLAVASDVSGEAGVTRFLLALAELAVAGVAVDTDALFRGRANPVRLADLPAAAPGWTINGHLVRGADGAVVRGGLRPATDAPGRLDLAARGEGGAAEREATVLEYLRGVRELVAAERDVMVRYLDGPAVAGDPLPAFDVTTVAEHHGVDGAATSGGLRAQVPARSAADPAGPTPAGPAAQPITGAALLAAVMQIVADRTGYPPDMLDPDLDLEADLSIDSIKRIEILGELADQVGLPGSVAGEVDESVIEELAQIKTLRGIVDWIDGHEGETTSSTATIDPEPPVALPPVALPPVAVPSIAVPSIAVPPHAVVAHVHLEPGAPPLARHPRDAAVVLGRVVLAAPPTSPLGQALAAALRRAGIETVEIEIDTGSPGGSHPITPCLDDPTRAAIEAADTFVYLPAEAHDARDGFTWLQPAALAGVGRIMIIGSPTPAAGWRGLALTMARELPETFVRLVQPGSFSGSALAERIIVELLDGPGPVEVVLTATGERLVPVATIAPTASGPVDGSPERYGADEGAAIDERSVVVLTGGARGITARVARALASTGCRLVLLGRTPLPDLDDLDRGLGAVDHVDGVAAAAGVDASDDMTPTDEIARAAAAGRLALRQLLIARGELGSPAEIERACTRLLAEHEIRETLAEVVRLGARVTYHAVDVADPERFAKVLAEIEAAHGPISLVVHGAGVLDDHLIQDKTTAGFARVFATKVDAARTILENVAATTRVVFFGSISGVFGNRGQVDYAAANSALDDLAIAASGAAGFRRVLSIDWGPWAGTGMVDESLEREYERRGVGLIDPDDGVGILLDQLRATDPDAPARIVVLRSDPATFAFTSPAIIDLASAGAPRAETPRAEAQPTAAAGV